MTIDQMYMQMIGIYRSMGMPSHAANEKMRQVKSVLNLIPERRAKTELEDILRTLAISRSPSAAAHFPGPAGSGADISDQLRMAAWELQSLAVNLLKKSDVPAHAETAIGVAAGFAGALLLIQHHGDRLAQLKPGAAILSDVLNESGMSLLEFFFGCETQAGITSDTLQDIPMAHQPHLSPQEINTEWVPHAVAVCWRHELTPSQAPFAAVMATVFLIEQLKAVLGTAIANAIATHFLIFCSKTVPVANGKLQSPI